MESCIINIKRFINKNQVICFDGEEEIKTTRSQQNKLNLLIRGIEYRRDKAHTLKLKKCVDYSALNRLGFKDRIWPYKCKYNEFVDDKPKDCPGRIYVYENECDEIIGYMVINGDHMENCKPEICAEKLKKRYFNMQTLVLAAKTDFEYNPEITELIKEHNPDDFKNIQKRVKKLVKRNSSRRMSQANRLFEDDYDISENKVQVNIDEPTEGNGLNGTMAVDSIENKMDVTEISQSFPLIENKTTFEMIDDSTEIKSIMVTDPSKTVMEETVVVQQSYNNKMFPKTIPTSVETVNNTNMIDTFLDSLNYISTDELDSWLKNDEMANNLENLLMDIDNEELENLLSSDPDVLLERLNILLDQSELILNDQTFYGNQICNRSSVDVTLVASSEMSYVNTEPQYIQID